MSCYIFFHKWSKWEYHTINATVPKYMPFQHGLKVKLEVEMRDRICEKCGLKQRKHHQILTEKNV